MGLNLLPANKSLKPLEYNWGSWKFLVNCLNNWGVDTKDFSERNEGSLLNAEVCRTVADVIEKNLDQLAPEDQIWLREHIELWRLSGGFEQW